MARRASSLPRGHARARDEQRRSPAGRYRQSDGSRRGRTSGRKLPERRVDRAHLAGDPLILIGFRPAGRLSVPNAKIVVRPGTALVQIEVGGSRVHPAQVVAIAMISPCGLTMMEWPNSSQPSSMPAFAVATARRACFDNIRPGLSDANETPADGAPRSHPLLDWALGCCSPAGPVRLTVSPVRATLRASVGRCRSSCPC